MSAKRKNNDLVLLCKCYCQTYDDVCRWKTLATLYIIVYEQSGRFRIQSDNTYYYLYFIFRAE